MGKYRYGEYCGKCGKTLLVGVCPWCFAEDCYFRIEELESQLTIAREALEEIRGVGYELMYQAPETIHGTALAAWFHKRADEAITQLHPQNGDGSTLNRDYEKNT